jgi:hypothetical protein
MDLQDLNRGETREIFWNAPEIFKEHFGNILGFLYLGLPVILFTIWALTILYPLWRWYSIVRRGQPENRFDRLPLRFYRLLFEGVGQGRVVREPSGVAHQVLFVSFVILFLGTALITVEADTPLDFYFGPFYAIYKLMMDLAGVGLIASCGYFLWRRFTVPPRALEQPAKMLDNFENESGYGFPLVMLLLIGVTGFLLEASRIVAEPRSSEGLAFIGAALAKGFAAAGSGAQTHHAIWIVHMIIVLSFLYSLTATKLRHMFLGPANIFFKRLGPGHA